MNHLLYWFYERTTITSFIGFMNGLLSLPCRLVKLGHRFSQISTEIWFFVAFIILVIRVHPCPQNGNSYTIELRSVNIERFYFLAPDPPPTEHL
jgi:hypothetical protein